MPKNTNILTKAHIGIRVSIMNNMPLYVITNQEDIFSDIDGTVIDIETIGDFDKRYRHDSRNYRNIKQVIFGCIDTNKLCIYCACGNQGITELQEITKKILGNLKRPFYAFNCVFESSVWFNHIGIRIEFDGELQRFRYENKKEAVASLQIPNYDDPFYDEGVKCIEAWNCGNVKHAVAHNRACLLKERDILIKRGYRIPDKCAFIEKVNEE
ncbi:hypothetical protein ACFLVN_02490 [Chloroflexota bacterium]